MLSVCTRHPQPAQNLRRRQSRPSIRIPRPTPVPKIAAQLIEILGCLNGSRVRCTIRLHPLPNTSSDLAVRHLCAELNTTETLFPGTELRLIYDLVSSKNL